MGLSSAALGALGFALLACGSSGTVGSAAQDASASDSGLLDVGLDACADRFESSAESSDAGGDTPLDAGSVTIVGTLDDASPKPAVSALASYGTAYQYVDIHLETPYTLVTMVDFADNCGNVSPPGDSTLFLSLFQDPSSTNAIVSAPGAFQIWLPPLPSPDAGNVVPSQPTAVLSWSFSDADGGGSVETAQSGSVTIKAVSATSISGSFDATFIGGHLTGSFVAPICGNWTRNGSIP